mgnify:CR=1 FL=1
MVFFLPGLVAMSRATLYGLSLIAGNGISAIHSSLDFIMSISNTTWSVTQKNQLCGTRDFFRSKSKKFGVLEVMYKCVVLIFICIWHTKLNIFYKMILCIIHKCMPFYETALSIILSFWFLPPIDIIASKRRSLNDVVLTTFYINYFFFSFVNVISCVFRFVVFIVV